MQSFLINLIINHLYADIYFQVYKQSYQQNELLNGVTLKFMEAKGINNSIKQIGYLMSFQDIIFIAGNNIVGFNSQKKIQQIYAQAKNVQILKTFYFKAIQKQYIVWVQNHNTKKLLIVVQAVSKKRIYQSPIDINHRILHISLSFSHARHLIDRLPIIGYITQVDFVDVFYYCIMDNSFQPTYSCTQIIYEFNDLKISSDTMQPLFIYQNKLLCIRFELNRMEGKIDIQIRKYLQCSEGDMVVYDINDYMVVVVTEQFLCMYSITDKNLLYKYDLCSIFQLNPHLLLVNDVKINQSSMIFVHNDELSISAFNISQGGAKLIGCNKLELQNLNQIIKIFINPYNPQITSITQHHPALLHKTSNDIPHESCRSIFTSKRNNYFEITTSHMTLANVRGSFNKTDVKLQKYQNLMICPWLTQPFIQTDRSILSKNIEADLGCIVKCSAIHPSGLQMLIGMNDCFRIYFVSFQKMHFSYIGQPMKQCQAVAYSHFGNCFAVSSSFIINIYDSNTYRKIKSFSYSSNTSIERIWFDQQSFYCMLKGKRLIQYEISQYKQILSFNPKSYSESIQQSSVQSIFYDKYYGVVVLSIMNKIIFINTENYESMGSFEFPTVTCMQYSKILKTLFLGTQSGAIICFPWPNKPSQISKKHPTFYYHNSQVKLIKVTSNNKYLLSASSQGSFYKCQIHIYSGMKKLKHFQLIEDNKQYLNQMCNFLKENGLAPFTHTEKIKKDELIKQLEQQAKNGQFMYPEQSNKQRVGILDNIEAKRTDFYRSSQIEIDPLKKKTILIKKQCFALKKQIQQQQNQYRQTIDKINTGFQKQLNELIRERQKLQIEYDKNLRQNEKQISVIKQKYRVIKQHQKITNKMQLQSQQHIVDDASRNSMNIMTGFLELNEVEEQKNSVIQRETDGLNATIQSLRSRNGLLNCRNSQIEKEIFKFKRKIQESVQMIFHIKESLSKIQKKSVKLTNDDDGTMSKVYRQAHKETKQLIKRDKQIDINIHYYEREKNILIELQRILQRTEKQIDKVVEDNFENKKIGKILQEKINQIKLKKEKFQQKNKGCKINRINTRNKLKDFAKILNLYIMGTVSKTELKQHLAVNKKSNKAASSQRESTIKMEQQIAKSLTQEEKIYRMMRNGKKIYANSLKKMNTQNQDLLNSFNNLSYEHKYLNSIIKTEDEKIRKTCQEIEYIPIKKKGNKSTPFQKYILNKTKAPVSSRGTQRRLKTLPANQYNF